MKSDYSLRETEYRSRRADRLIGLLLFAGGLLAYVGTLAPTVLEGDAALFQYTPAVLGVTYPTGYPVYILLGKLWVTLFPVGELAWRMNLLSAVCASLALPLMYGAARRLHGNPARPGRISAVAAVLLFATLPTFWRWSTETKIYALNILLFSGVLFTLTRARPPAELTPAGHSLLSPGRQWQRSLSGPFRRWPLALPVLLAGLQIGVHSTTVLLLPGLLLFVWLNPDLRPHLFTPKKFAGHLLLLALPGLLYFYIPLRGEWLIAQYSRPEAIARGLLADFYHSGLSGWLRYFSAADFTGGVVTNWGLVPRQFFTVYLPLLIEDFTGTGVALGVIGGVGLAVRRPRVFWPLFLLYAAPIPFVLTYGQGEQSAFLLPSFLIFAMFGGYSLVLLSDLTGFAARRLPFRAAAPTLAAALILLALVPLQFLPRAQWNINWLTIKWSRDIYNEWDAALNHPLPSGAGMLAHWGDLTSFWYMQHAESLRPDLRGVYPPTEAQVTDWFERGHPDLFIAGPLQGWAAGIETRYRLIPWGRLVRIAPRSVPPESLLPNLPRRFDVEFGGQIRLTGADFAPQTPAAADFPVALAWQTLRQLPPDATLSLRLAQNGVIAAQLDERLRSGWFPSQSLPAGQPLLSYSLLPVPLGTLPGSYRLQLVVYPKSGAPWLPAGGGEVFDLGPVEIGPPPPNAKPDPQQFKPAPNHDFNGEITLSGFNYSVSRVGQGKGFALRLLWQARRSPVDNYTLLVEQLDAAGNLLRATEHRPTDDRAPTAGWQPGQFVRDAVNLVVPASAPPGEDALRVRLSWLRSDGSRLKVRRWGISVDDGLTLPPLRVTEKKGRTFDLPPVEQPVDANFGNRARLVGFNAPDGLQISRSECGGNCAVQVETVWQGIGEMEQPYRIFAHLVGPAGGIAAQSDAQPGERGRHPTTGWLPGEVVTHPVRIALSPDVAPGSYTLRLGMYLPPAGPRLPVENSTTDFVDIATITVK